MTHFNLKSNSRSNIDHPSTSDLPSSSIPTLVELTAELDLIRNKRARVEKYFGEKFFTFLVEDTLASY